MGARVESWIAGVTGSMFALLATVCLVAGPTLLAAELGLVAVILGVTASACRRAEDRVRFQPRALALLEEHHDRQGSQLTGNSHRQR